MNYIYEEDTILKLFHLEKNQLEDKERGILSCELNNFHLNHILHN